MKKLFFIVAAVFALVGTNFNTAFSQQATNYLDLSIDPVVPGGVTPEKEAELISQGWVKKVIIEDVYVEGVASKNADGVIYRRSGVIQAGTICYINTNDPNGEDNARFAVCSNVWTYWRWQVRLENL